MFIIQSPNTLPVPQAKDSPPPSSQKALDAALAKLQSNKEAWLAVDLPDCISILDEILRDSAFVAKSWVAAALEAKGIAPDSNVAAEEWLNGPVCVHRYLRLLRQSLLDIQNYGSPRIPGPVSTRSDGQVIAHIIPYDRCDRLFYLWKIKLSSSR